MIYLPDTNVRIALLRGRDLGLVARWRAVNAGDMVPSSVVIYELRYGTEHGAQPAREHRRLDEFPEPLASLPFDNACARKCAEIRHRLARNRTLIGPHDLQIAATALCHGLTLVTHNTMEFSRIPDLRLEDWESNA